MTTPPFNISAEAINRIAEISALLERHNIALEGEHGLKLRKANRIKTIHSSLAIEGNTLSEDEVRDIINGKQVVAPIRQIQEVKNAIAASTAKGQSGPFIDFMLYEILKTLQKNITEEVPNKAPNKVPNKSELSVLRLLADNPHLTRVELAEQIGMTDNGIKKIIANMKAAGWIERKGSNKTGYWIVKYNLND